ncbi:MAG: hypothetical protein DLM61_13265 [Pseudonocardiales bacterium]|nr:TetR family transcriptional regulator [Pseudonocardiales bacterium]PZS29242.1 MAG: hypothetical protein DLM61_13265 [Pseudonocardiales bacterium]
MSHALPAAAKRCLADKGFARTTSRDIANTAGVSLAGWTRAVEAFEAHRTLLVASVEALAQVDRSPEVRASLADGLRQGREGLAELFGTPDDDPRRPVGLFLQALMTGVITQWIVDPASAPAGPEIALALRRLCAATAPDRPFP